VVEDIDGLVGELMTALEPIRDDTALIITSDHGEMLGDHGACGHGSAMWQSLTHVPFVANGVGDLPDTINGASVPDLITHAVGVEHVWPTSRTDALPLVSQRDEKRAYSVDGQHKGVWTKDGLSVFDMDANPKESQPIEGLNAAMEQARDDFEATTPEAKYAETQVVLNPESVRRLQALGYLSE
jgi:hypothetical protein